MSKRSPLSSRTRRLLALAPALLVAAVAAPQSAGATDIQMATDAQIAGDPPKKRLGPGPLKPGPYGEFAWRPALGLFSDGVIPEMRFAVAVGAKLSSRFKLGVRPHIDLLLDRPKASGVGIDAIGTVYTWRNLYARWGFGVASASPNGRGDGASRPGYGGLVGLGYEWTMNNKKKNVHLGAGVDYDIRWLKDGTPRSTLISGIHFTFG